MTGILTFPAIVTPEVARVADLRTSSLKMDALPDTLNVLQWIQLFDPYVKTTTEGGAKVFTLDEQSTNLPSDNDYLTAARVSCAVANAIPASQRPAESPAISKQPYNEAAKLTESTNDHVGPGGPVTVTMDVTQNYFTVTGLISGDTFLFPPPQRQVQAVHTSDVGAAVALSGSGPLSGRSVTLLLPHVGDASTNVMACLLIAGSPGGPAVGTDQVIVLTGNLSA